MPIFALSIFLSAFLLFQIQPLIGKFILPWFGGAPAVWSTVMLFFQVLLTDGYAYAYWLIGRSKKQTITHVSLIALAVAILLSLAFVWTSPITPDSSWKPQDVAAPVFDIFKLLLVSVGLPYFILASNSPLMQAWFSRAFPRESYARLYAVSNFGSLLGLLAYPVLIEPNFSLRIQGWMWSGGFAFFGLLASRIALQNGRASPLSNPTTDPARTSGHPTPALTSLWIALSATASMFLLSTTNQISQEVAVIPFLWVLPLALYLLSFILTFSGEHGYNRKFYAGMFIASTALTVFVMLDATAIRVYWQILAYSTLLFSACMLCHGELYRLRPPAERLTTFYLMVSIGGAIGGLFVSLIAPLIFNGYWEFFVALAMTIAILLSMRDRARDSIPRNDVSARARFIFFVFGLATVMLVLIGAYFSGSLYVKRNFYGVIRVREELIGSPPQPARLMAHGITVHGLQFIAPEDRDLPTTYYVREGGAGLAILNHPRYHHGLRVGMLGVGVGTLATYGQPGDVYRLYEINPVVTDLAEGEGGYFSFVRDSKADVTMILGDARLSLERELEETGSQNFDVLVLDTFSSDSIPVHLITKEAMALYLEHLAPEGIIAAHITNLHLDLQPVFWGLAQYYGLSMVRVNYEGDSGGGYASHWILLARNPALLDVPAIQDQAVDLSGYSTSLRLWTDDYSNLFQILK
ncbi:MAG: fused MFS/spermidine synthase [Anaerolineales bacterium]|nr:fused MFS/spermidine synthase [Anaerolineales bacterium]NUQ83515.1 fused MFS/spermidine synthase [Anaerolineales bacterium]